MLIKFWSLVLLLPASTMCDRDQYPEDTYFSGLFPDLQHTLGAAVSKNEFLQQTIQLELTRRLSNSAQLVLPGSGDFAEVNARYSDYKRPSYIAAVKVATERDVVETVSG
jgi:hypothetical protein